MTDLACAKCAKLYRCKIFASFLRRGIDQASLRLCVKPLIPFPPVVADSPGKGVHLTQPTEPNLIMRFLKALILLAGLLITGQQAHAQLDIINNSNAQALAQKIAGEGVTISNVTLTGGSLSTGFFYNRGGTNLRVDSGIVLTTGRARTVGADWGLNSDGTQAFAAEAATPFGLPGDLDLATAINSPLNESFDATVLEFDFVPLGDSIKFNYVFASEEYQPDFVCEFNDAFAFFISGPGIPGMKNIALIPGTNTPVSIINVNNVLDGTDPLCPRHPQYYVDNSTNRTLTYNGHTTVLAAEAAVTPCQTYHLKLVIMDVVDDFYDSGVFLEAGSLRSEPVKIDNQMPVGGDGLAYLAEGCSPGSVHIFRSAKKATPQTINLTFGGNAVNGTDVALIPSTYIIPANDSIVVIPLVALPDGLAEGSETLKIYVSPVGCGPAVAPLDSIEIRILDIAPLAIIPEDSARLCRTGSIQLEAETGYNAYNWSTGSGLSATNIRNPLATPTAAVDTYICTATTATCTARDSVTLRWKTIELLSKTDVACRNGNTGAIRVKGTGWEAPLSYAIDNGPFGTGDNFSGLTAGTHWVKVRDQSGCIDSLRVDLVQSFPDLDLSTVQAAATCSLVPDGTITVTATGGSAPYLYSSGTGFGNLPVLTVADGTYTVSVRDANNCTSSLSGVVVPKINNIVVDAQANDFVCEGTGYQLSATTNGTTVNWTPAASIANGNTLFPTATPPSTQYYYITATTGSCQRIDSVLLTVRPAPIPNAGNDTTICYGVNAVLNAADAPEYIWKPDPTFTTNLDIKNPSASPLTSTSYFLHVRDIHGCQSLSMDEVRVTVTPPVAIFAGNDTVIALNQPLQLQARDVNGSGITTWSWSPASFLNDASIAAPVALFTSPALTSPYEYSYRVTGTTDEGCIGWDDVKVKVYQGPEIYVATGFSPNGDGRNDLLIPVPVGIRDFHYFRVFNRWGQAIYQSADPTQGWNGMLQDKKQPSGVYVWMTAGTDYLGKPVVRKGTVTLIR